jgi:large subunit ribosomal protein L15
MMADEKPETQKTKEPADAGKGATAKAVDDENAHVNAERIGLHNLSPADGSRSNRKRVGRGHGSGHGKTSGRGNKGAGQRAGRKHNVAYEGGQTPIQMRMRKLRGPHMKKSMPFEKFRTRSQQINVSDLEERFDAGTEVNPETLKANGLAKRPLPVKILGDGEITKSLKVTAHGFSASAREKIEGAGGSCETIEG